MIHQAYEPLRVRAVGRRSDYALDPRPLKEGGQGQVFRARHKATGLVVAMKRLLFRSEDAVARMRREIEIGTALRERPHVVPVLDADPDFTWFVMPLAEGTVEDSRVSLRNRPLELRRMIEEVVEGLDVAHKLGWLHRDITPANILRWADQTWALGDWGIGRRPRGQTTLNRTQVGVSFGTIGFAAPELELDAHAATPAADIYSLGQVIGWALTDLTPQANVAMLPASGAWRAVVKNCTKPDPTSRPQDCGAFLDLLSRELVRRVVS